MTSAQMPRDLDPVLETWLSEGPPMSADRVIAAALTHVDVTPQVRSAWRVISLNPASGRRLALLAASVALLATLVGIGFATGFFSLDRQPPPGPIESESPTATEAGEFVLFSSVADGYEVLIPVAWRQVTSDYPNTRMWVGPDGELTISYGTSIFEGGEVTVCAPELPSYVTCQTQTNGYSVPFDPESDGVGPNSVEGSLDRCDGGCPVTTDETPLDVETASRDRAVIAGQQVTYVSTFHNRRPIVIYWSEPEAVADASRVDLMRTSFRFLEPSPDASQQPFVDPTELVLHSDPDGGYQLLVPRFWEESAHGIKDGGQFLPGVTTFGSGGGFGTRADPGLTISVGQRDGSVFLCQPQCKKVIVHTLAELADSLSSRLEEAGSAAPREVGGTIVLGGEPGRFERPGYRQSYKAGRFGLGAMVGGGNCLGCPNMLYQAFTFHDGRPVVLSFDYWDIAFSRIDSDYVADMLRSFAFVPRT